MNSKFLIVDDKELLNKLLLSGGELIQEFKSDGKKYFVVLNTVNKNFNFEEIPKGKLMFTNKLFF